MKFVITRTPAAYSSQPAIENDVAKQDLRSLLQIASMEVIAPARFLFKPAASHWSHKQELTLQQANTLILRPGDTLTLTRAADSTTQQRAGFYFPREYRDISWQRARAIFDADPGLDALNLKRQHEGCYRLTFWYRLQHR